MLWAFCKCEIKLFYTYCKYFNLLVKGLQGMGNVTVLLYIFTSKTKFDKFDCIRNEMK